MDIKFISYKFETKTTCKQRDLFGDKNIPSTMPIHSYVLLANKKDVKKYTKEGYLPVSETAYAIAKLLKYNEHFQKFIQKETRRTPAGRLYLEKFTEKRLISWVATSPTKKGEEFLKCSIIGEVEKNYTVHPEVLKQIPTLLQYECIFLPLIDPEIKILTDCEIKENTTPNADYNNMKLKSININISANVSVNSIRVYLENHKKEIEKGLLKLDSNILNLPKDWETILAARNRTHKMKYKDLGEKLNILEASAKSYYYKIKKEINNLFKPKRI